MSFVSTGDAFHRLVTRFLALPLIAATLLIGGCQHSADPEATGPLLPERLPNVAHIEGIVTDARGMVVTGSQVTLRRADAGCSSPTDPITVTSGWNGEFEATLSGGAGPAFLGCVVIDATAGNVEQRQSVPVFFSSTETDRNRAEVSIRLPRASVPINSEAERIVGLLGKAVNSMDRSAVDELVVYVPGLSETLWPAIDAHRRILGHIERISYAGGEPRRSNWTLHGVGGTTLSATLVTEELTLLHSPVLDYTARADSRVHVILAAAVANDIERMQRALTADDEDISRATADEVIAAIRSRFDPSTVSAALVGVNETSATLRYRLSGLAPDGTPAEEELLLVFGDGLVGFRGF
ncbi:MAG TPA: hypothetical protein VM534_04170 [Thermoanaerobaculia bacterium]|nr:hypothetical protein [Thermoanaerobaculia bacterium]